VRRGLGSSVEAESDPSGLLSRQVRPVDRDRVAPLGPGLSGSGTLGAVARQSSFASAQDG